MKNAGMYVTLTILIIDIQRGVHMKNFTSLFQQCYIPLMPMHATNSFSSHQIPRLAQTLEDGVAFLFLFFSLFETRHWCKMNSKIQNAFVTICLYI